jgi:hypothetical protein
MKSKKEIEDMLDKVLSNKEAIAHNLRGMSYPEGIEAALEWVMGLREEPPVDDSDCEE